MRFSSTVCKDSQGTGLDAFQLLIPAGWVFQGGITWVTDNPGTPVYASFAVRNPKGLEALEAFPTMPFYWTNAPGTLMLHPLGTRYFGNEVRSPGPARQLLQQLVLPRVRNTVTGLRIVDVQDAPELAEYVQSLRPPQDRAGFSEGAKLLLSYTDPQGHPLDEQLIGVVEGTRAQIPGTWAATEHIFWQISTLFAARAPAGRLTEAAEFFDVILRSIRVNPQWYARCAQISQYLIQNQIQRIHNIGQLSHQISRMHSEISNDMLNQFYQRQEVYDRVATQFSENIRGVESYYDPHKGFNVELPNTYAHAWANGLGEYVLTDDPNFNPAVGSNLTWTPLEPGQKG